MLKTILLFACCGLLLICSSCAKKNLDAVPLTAQTIVANVNDTAVTYSFNVTVNVTTTANGNSANFKAYQTGSSNSIYVFLNNFNAGSNVLSTATGNDIELFDGAENFYDSNIHGGSGKIIITRFDTINKILTGTFNARVYSRTDTLSYIDVNNGGFNMQYQ